MGEIDVTQEKSKPKQKWGPWKIAALVACLVFGCLFTRFVLHLLLPRNFTATGSEITLRLPSGDFQCSFFAAERDAGVFRGLVILGSGDGGWSYWEDGTAHSLAGHGYAVVGWDCRKFADGRSYDHAALVEGFNSAVEAASGLTPDAGSPVWFAGWSTGAEQSVAAAASLDRTPRLRGLLLAAPGTRGRFGITSSDLLGVTPAGPDTFALKDMAKQIEGVRVAQFAAGLDPMDDVDWLAGLTVPHRIFELPGLLHDMGGAGEEFQTALLDAIDWTVQPEHQGTVRD